jgi:hypothetical protein
MKRNIGPTTRVSTLLAAFALSMVVALPAHGACSIATVAGQYGFTLIGTLILPTGEVPAGAAGRIKIDPMGNVSGTEARNVGGDFANETLEGTLTVNSNCTGIAKFSVFESGVLVRNTVFSVVFDDNSTELRAIEKSLVLADGTPIPAVITVEAKKL